MAENGNGNGNGNSGRQDGSPTSQAAGAAAAKKTRPRIQAPEQPSDHSNSDAKKSHRRSVTIICMPKEETARVSSPSLIDPSGGRVEDGPVDARAKSPEKTEQLRNPMRLSVKDTGLHAKLPPERIRSPDTPKPDLANESEDSSGSSHTVTNLPPARRDSWAKVAATKQRKQPANKPNLNALHFLDSDSPQITPESIQRTFKEASKLSPDTAKSTSPSARSSSSTSTVFREDIFDVPGSHETDLSTSPERSIDGDPRGRTYESTGRRPRGATGRKRSYGTPEMPRGNVHHPHIPHIPPEELTPRGPTQPFVKHLPRAEKLPLTGYELLASRLSVSMSDRGGPPVRPIYRRFEALNHRMLLHLQDEICELEEQLHRLDTADTQNRRLPNGILPASRRAESMTPSELQWHKTDTLGKIGFKLEQYNRVLSSFRETLSLPPPTLDDMHQYRIFLSSYTPIAEAETQFLEATDDLVCLGYSDEEEATVDEEEEEEDAATPRSESPDFHLRRRVSLLSQSDISRRLDEKSTPSVSLDHDMTPPREPNTGSEHTLTYLSASMAVAVILPLFTFLVIPGFIGRMTVVCLVATGILGTLIQARVVMLRATQEFCVSVGLYGGVMAVLAAMVG